MEGSEEVFVCPVQKGVLLAFAADGVAVIGISSGEEKGERDAGEDGEDDGSSDKCSHDVFLSNSVILFCCGTEKNGDTPPIFGF